MLSGEDFANLRPCVVVRGVWNIDEARHVGEGLGAFFESHLHSHLQWVSQEGKQDKRRLPDGFARLSTSSGPLRVVGSANFGIVTNNTNSFQQAFSANRRHAPLTQSLHCV